MRKCRDFTILSLLLVTRSTFMRILVVMMIFSFSASAGLSDSIWSLIDKVKVKIGLIAAPKTIELPVIPHPKNNPTDLSVYQRQIDKLYPANKKMKDWSKLEAKKMNIGFVNELFSVVQVRVPQKSEIQKWYNVLEQGSPREGVYRALTLDDRYRSLESKKIPVTDQTVEFTNFYLKKYLEQSAESDLLSKLSAYSVKKIITGSTLKTLEVLSQKPEDLFAWYAVFSSEVAVQFPSVWSYSLRGNKDQEVHYQWAQQTPYQLILSEVIFKLHKVYNYLCRIKI